MFMYAAILVFLPALVLTEPHHEALETKIFNEIDSDMLTNRVLHHHIDMCLFMYTTELMLSPVAHSL